MYPKQKHAVSPLPARGQDRVSQYHVRRTVFPLGRNPLPQGMEESPQSWLAFVGEIER
jgi:hypothetical protein